MNSVNEYPSTESSIHESTQDLSKGKIDISPELVELITEKVYRLMLSDLWIDQERWRYDLRYPFK